MATETPTALALSRQGVPVWDPDGVPRDAIERGAYVLRDSEGGDPELILMATGTEVHIAHDALKILADEGVKVRLVSMPCLDRFEVQDQAYRDSVLPPSGQGARRGRGGRRAGLAPLGGRRRRGGRDARLRRLRPRQSALRALWLHGGEGRRSGATGAGR